VDRHLLSGFRVQENPFARERLSCIIGTSSDAAVRVRWNPPLESLHFGTSQWRISFLRVGPSKPRPSNAAQSEGHATSNVAPRASLDQEL